MFCILLQQADISCCVIGHNAARFQVTDFIDMYHGKTKYISNIPKPLSPFWNLSKIFSPGVWIGSCSALFVAVILALRIGGVKTALNLWATQFDNSAKVTAVQKSKPTKILLGFWLIYNFFIIQAYVCNLKAYLFSVDREPAIEHERDILATGSKFYILNGSYFHCNLKKSVSREMRQLIAKSDEEETYIPHVRGKITERFQREMKDNDYVYHAHDNLFEYNGLFRRKLFGYEPFRQSRNPIFDNIPHQGPIIGKNVPYRDTLLKINLRMISAGINDKFIRDFFPIKKNYEALNDTETPINILHLAATLCGLAIGILLASAVFLMEYFCSKL